ncbi:MAG: MFS transporter, partial [Actinomycetota bacterium]
VAQVITAYFLGMAIAPIPYGAISDRWGRKPVLWLSLSVYVVGAVLSALAPSFTLLLVGRFIWGVGAAGGRVVAFAILRDTHDGDRMARMMSFIMAVFIVVPVLAPSIGALIIRVAPWQATFWLSAVAGIALLAWSSRLGETLAPANRRTDLFATVPSTARRMATDPTIAAPVLALTAVMTVMSTYLASSELIIADLFGWGDRFPIIFGAVAAVFGAAALINGRLLDRMGIGAVIGPAAGVYLVAGQRPGRRRRPVR